MVLVRYISRPIFPPVVRSLDRPHPTFPMFVAQCIPHCVGLGPGAEQRSEVGVGLEICNGEKQGATDDEHGLPDFFVGSPPARSPLQEVEEVSDIVGHLGGGCRGAVLKINQTIMELPGHTNNHVVEITA